MQDNVEIPNYNDSIMSVSYTHLDVYKRQEMICRVLTRRAVTQSLDICDDIR